MIPLIAPDLTEAEARAAADVIHSGFVNEGELTAQLERRFAETVGTRYAVATTSCTAALAVSLMALEIKDRDVIVPDLTMIGTAMAVVLSGNRPVVVDVRPEDGCIDPRRVREAITPRTAAIIPVHLNGRNAVGDDLLELAREHRLALIEDAACALGSTWGEGAPRQLGTAGTAGCFSLAATKIITSGQGGIIVTNDAAFYERCMRLKNWGRCGGSGTIHPEVGFNFKLTDIQAAIVLQQLERLPALVARKRAIYARYRRQLGGRMFTREDHAGFCPWYMDVTGQALAPQLLAWGAQAIPIWPPLHQQPAMQLSQDDQRWPVASALAKTILWLPSSTTLRDEQIDAICDVIRTADGAEFSSHV